MDNIMLYLLKGPCSSLLRSSAIQLSSEDDELFTAIKKNLEKKRIPWQPSGQHSTLSVKGPRFDPWLWNQDLTSHRAQPKIKLKINFKKKRNLVNKLICRFCYRFPFEETMLGKHFYSNCKKLLFSTKNSNILN